MIGVNNWMDNGRFIILLKGNIRKGIYVKDLGQFLYLDQFNLKSKFIMINFSKLYI